MRFRLAAVVWVCFAMGFAGARGAEEAAPVGKPQAKLEVGQPAPEIAAMTLSGEQAGLAGLRGSDGKIIVLEFGSLTDPIFREHAAAVEFLAGHFADKAKFVIVYQREAHASDGAAALDVNTSEGFNLAAPRSMEERTKLARQAVDRLEIKKETMLVDGWANTSSLRYGSYPNMTFVVDGKGNLVAGYPFMDVGKVRLVLTALTTGQEVPPELKGSGLHAFDTPAPFDFEGAAMDMTGGRGPATVATVLDRVALSPGQRQILIPAVADFLADVTEFRQARQNLPADQRRGPGRGGRGAPPPPAAAQGGEAAKVSTPEDVQRALSNLKAAAQRVQMAAASNLKEKDAKELIGALANMAPAQALFAVGN